MSAATKRGKLLPDLLVARDATPRLASSYEPRGGEPARCADILAHARSRPSILNWVLVKRADVLNDVEAAMTGRALSQPPSRSDAQAAAGRTQRAAGRKHEIIAPASAEDKAPLQRRVASESDGASRRNAQPAAEAIFCEKGDAAPAASRPWCWDHDLLEEAPLRTASCGRRAKSKARRNSP